MRHNVAKVFRVLAAVALVAINLFTTLPVHAASGYFGSDVADDHNYSYSGVIYAQRFQNTVGTGTLTRLEVYTYTESGNVRLGIYSDNAGSPNSLLLDAGAVACVEQGWAAAIGLSLSVTLNDYYWLVYNKEVSGNVNYQTGGTYLNVGYAYGALPSTFPGGAGSLSGTLNLRAYVAEAPPLAASVSATPSAVSVNLTGNITDVSSSGNATSRGFQYGTSSGVYTLNWTQSGNFGAGIFTANVTSLNNGTLYYWRAFAANTNGIGYGSEMSFTTDAVPTVVSVSSTPAPTSVNLTGNITSVHGANATSRGFQYGIGAGNFTSNWTDTGNFGIAVYTTNVTGLTTSSIYAWRAFAANYVGIGYGTEGSFDTSGSPSVTSGTSTSANTSINMTGTIVSVNAGGNATSRGFQYGQGTGNFTANVTQTGDFGTGAFSANVTPLTTKTTYSWRAFAVNPSGIGYGIEESATTAGTPDVTSVSSQSAATSANLTGNITSVWGQSATSRGFQYGQGTGNFTVNVTQAGTYSAGQFTANITGLSGSTTYSWRAFAVNPSGISYGVEKSFSTSIVDSSNAIQAQSLTMYPSIETAAIVVGILGDADTNASAVTEYKLSTNSTWSTAPSPVEDKRASLTGTWGTWGANPYVNQFRGIITGLADNKTYDVRVTFSDADGVIGTNPITGTFTTRSDTVPLGSGSTYYVAKTGNDTTGNGAIGTPWLTIQKAANSVSPGDTVYVESGVYNEEVSITTSGNAGNYITFMHYGTDTVIVDAQNTRSHAFYLDGASYVHLHGFTAANTTDSAIIHLYYGSNYCVVDNCTLINANLSGTNLRGAVTMEGSNYCLVRNNTVTFPAGSGDRNTDGMDFITAATSTLGNIVHDNYIDGQSHITDGIGDYSEDYPDNGINFNDVYRNTILNTADDGIQLDGACMGNRIWGNTINNTFAGISVCPTLVGPVYVYRNTIASWGRCGFKLGDDHYGAAGYQFFYHNDLYDTTGNDAINETDQPLDHIITANNIFYSGDYVLESYQAVSTSMDYDYYYTTAGSRFTKWNNIVYDSWAAFNAATGMEAHAVHDNSDPGWTSAATGNFVLLASSPCRNTGVVLYGFNDANSPWPYLGTAPDIGALEYNSGGSPAPSLTGGTVTPATGTVSINFTYLVNYYHPSNTAPTFVSVNIDGTAHDLTVNGTSYSTGVNCTYNTTLALGSHWYQFSAGDGTTNVTTANYTGPSVGNTAPTLSSGNVTPSSGYVTTNFTLGVVYFDTDNDTPSYVLVNIDGTNYAMSSNGSSTTYNTTGVTFTYNTTLARTTHSYLFLANDGQGHTVSTSNTTNSPTVSNRAPALASGNVTPTTGTATTTFTYSVNYTDADNDAPSYIRVNINGVNHAVSGPGTTFNTTGVLYTYNTTLAKGTYSYQFQTSDSYNATVTSNTTNSPTLTNIVPVLAAIGNKSVNELALLTFTTSATDGDVGDTLTYGASNLPTGATFNTTTRVFSWTPTYAQAGTYNTVTFNVTDGTDSDSEVITITVNNVTVAPILAPIGNKSVTVNNTLTFTISAVDPDGGTITYSISGNPAGSTLNNTTGAFSWLPLVSGSYPGVTLTATDNDTLTDSEIITISVDAVGPSSTQIFYMMLAGLALLIFMYRSFIQPASGESGLLQLVLLVFAIIIAVAFVMAIRGMLTGT